MRVAVRAVVLVLAPAALTLAALAAFASSATAGTSGGPIVAVGAENEYANVISQIGRRYVTVSAIENNPNIDPHSFEASPSIARLVSAAQVVVQNGLGYDTFMNNIESASPNSARKVIDVQKLLGLKSSTPNPHLWYRTTTMPAVAERSSRRIAPTSRPTRRSSITR
jgi:zinc/manganese transport system substrate-binding protein